MKKRWVVLAVGKSGYRRLVDRYWFESSAKKRVKTGNKYFRDMGWDNDEFTIEYVVERDNS